MIWWAIINKQVFLRPGESGKSCDWSQSAAQIPVSSFWKTAGGMPENKGVVVRAAPVCRTDSSRVRTASTVRPWSPAEAPPSSPLTSWITICAWEITQEQFVFPPVRVGNPSTPRPNWRAGIEESQHLFKSWEPGNSETLSVTFLTERKNAQRNGTQESMVSMVRKPILWSKPPLLSLQL